MAASYPGSLKSFTTKTDGVDKYQAAHMNSAQEEIVAVQTELGTDPAGSCTDVKTRLYVCIDNDGAIRKGTGFPGSPIDGQMFYRTDQNILYVYNGSGWDAQGQSLSNTVFQIDGDNAAYNAATSYAGSPDLFDKYKHIASITTVTVYVYAHRNGGSGTSTIKVDIGGQNVEMTTSSDTYEWKNGNITVSSLTAGTVYDIGIYVKNTGGQATYLDNIKAFGS